MCIQPLVAIADEKVWVHCRKIDGNLANAMRTVNEGENLFVAQMLDHLLPWHPCARNRAYRINNTNSDPLSLRLRLVNSATEAVHDFIVGTGQPDGDGHLVKLHSALIFCVDQVLDVAFHSSVACRKIQNCVSRRIHDVSQDSIGAR